jgi:hypothetical protein
VWKCLDNPDNTYKERAYRLLIVTRILELLNVPHITRLEQTVNTLSVLEHNIDKINDFYNQWPRTNNVSYAELIFNDLENFVCQLFSSKKVNIRLTVDSNECNGAPWLCITHNETVLYQQQVSQGTHQINLSIIPTDINQLSLEMYGKNMCTDTQVVNGKIVRDKCITLKEFIFDNVDILVDHDFFRTNFVYIDRETAQLPKPGFWSNSTLSVEWPNMFSMFYHTHTSKNSKLVDRSKYQQDDIRQIHNLENKIVDLLRSIDQ